MNKIWNLILHELKGDTLVNPQKYNPQKSGRYLCTCVRIYDGKEIARYLQMMEYDAENNHWYDCGNPSSISHNILAWTDKVKPCEFTDYRYEIGGYFIAKEEPENEIER